MSTCVKIALAFETRKRVAISFGAKLSAIDTTINPASTIAKYIITAVTVIGMSMAIASPLEKLASSAFATNLEKEEIIFPQRWKQWYALKNNDRMNAINVCTLK